MAKRKINRVGQNTLTVSIPAAWAKKNNLKPGDEIEVEEEDKSLILFTNKKSKNKKEFTIDVDHLDYFALAKVLISCYEEGFNKITLIFKKKMIHDAVTEKDHDLYTMLDRLIGRLVTFEVTKQTSDKIIIEDISESLSKTDNLINRIFFLLEEYLNQLIIDIKTNNKDDLKAREPRHDAITKYVALITRTLMEDNSLSKNEFCHTYLLMHYLDKATDFIRYSYKNTENYEEKISKNSIELMEKAVEYIETFRTHYYKFEYHHINKLDFIRRDVKKLHKKISEVKPKELLIISHIESLVELLNGGVKSIIALNLNKLN